LTGQGKNNKTEEEEKGGYHQRPTGFGGRGEDSSFFLRGEGETGGKGFSACP